MSWLRRLFGTDSAAQDEPATVMTEDDLKAAEAIRRVGEIPGDRWSLVESWSYDDGDHGRVYGTQTDRGLPVTLRIAGGAVQLSIDGVGWSTVSLHRSHPTCSALGALAHHVAQAVQDAAQDVGRRAKSSLLDRM